MDWKRKEKKTITTTKIAAHHFLKVHQIIKLRFISNVRERHV